tara:strand:- start:287 stop:1231 length:945 start_codon:yes stop_codon:yes gene_type:complete
MHNTFYYLVPNDYDNIDNLKNEYFIIKELMNNNFTVIPIYSFREVDRDADGLIFNSLKAILNNKKILIYAKKYKLPVFWWYFDTAKTKFTRKRRVIKIAKQVSIFFNKDQDLFSDYIKSGINPVWLDQGVPSLCKFSQIKKYKYDVSFFGNYEKSHLSRSKLLKEIDNEFNLVIYTNDEKKFLSKGFNNVESFVPINIISKKIAKINLILNGNYNSAYCWSNRIHLIIGSGGFSLVEDLEGLKNEYTHNQHCIYFNNKKDLIEKINFWLLNSNSNNREKIRKNGYNYAHNQKSYKIKTNLFIKITTNFINNNHG